MPLDDDIDRRRRMWVRCASPLFDFFIDWEPLDEDFQSVGDLAREVGYSPEDVKEIYWDEVVPAVMGTWGPMDPASAAWLEAKIRDRPRIAYWLSWLLRPWWGATSCAYWRRIKNGL